MRASVLIYLFLFPAIILAQVGIGTAEPQAQLDIVASSPDNPTVNDGLLIPRMAKFPSTPTDLQHGMLVYLTNAITDFTPGFYYWNNDTRKWEGLGGNSTSSFFKPGTSSNPNNISDPMYRLGSIGIGTQAITAKLQIALNSPADIGIKKGLEVDNNNPATDNFVTYGIISDNRSATNAVKYGIKNNVGGLGNGVHYGIHTKTFQNSGTSDIYGIYNEVGKTFGANSDNFGIYSVIGSPEGIGTVIGIYSKAIGSHTAKVFAGYFVGRVAIGLSPQEEYIFPATKGNPGQILVLESNGNMNWKHPNSKNYSTTGGASGDFVISDEIYSLRINNGISGLIIPPANLNNGRIINLIAWKGTGTKPFIFSGGDDIYDPVFDSSIISISGKEMITIQSAGNRWIVINQRKNP